MVSPDTSTFYGELTEWLDFTESGSLCIETVIDCLRAISDGMIGVECRHTNFNLLALELFFFLNFSTPVYKMWILQEPNTIELWNKLHFEEEKTESMYRV